MTNASRLEKNDSKPKKIYCSLKLRRVYSAFLQRIFSDLELVLRRYLSGSYIEQTLNLATRTAETYLFYFAYFVTF